MKTSSDKKKELPPVILREELLVKESSADVIRSDSDELIVMYHDLFSVLRQAEVGIERIELLLRAIEIRTEGKVSPRKVLQEIADIVRDIRHGVPHRDSSVGYDGLIKLRGELKEMQSRLLSDAGSMQVYLPQSRESEEDPKI